MVKENSDVEGKGLPKDRGKVKEEREECGSEGKGKGVKEEFEEERDERYFRRYTSGKSREREGKERGKNRLS